MPVNSNVAGGNLFGGGRKRWTFEGIYVYNSHRKISREEKVGILMRYVFLIRYAGAFCGRV